MATKKEYRIYCITEAGWQYTWTTAPPTVCPNDAGHTVNPDSVQEVSTNTIELAIATGADENFTTTLVSTQLSDISLELPSITDTFVGEVSTQSLTNKSIVGSTNVVHASHLQTLGGSAVNVISAAPSSGQILVADDSTNASWQSSATKYFLTIDAIGGISILGSWTDISWDTNVLIDPEYSHTPGSAEVTLNASANFVINVDITLISILALSNPLVEIRIMMDTGGGYTEVQGTRCLIFLGLTSLGNSASITTIVSATTGTKIKIQGRKIIGLTATIETLSNGSRFMINSAQTL